MEDMRYPIGKFEWVPAKNEEQMAQRRAEYINVIAKLPEKFSRAVTDLTSEQLDTPYRPEGWTVRQLVHHVPDSHANAFIRFKLALTEYEPTIKPYKEDMWAKLPDIAAPIDVSLQMLGALHVRWVTLLNGMDSSDFARTLRHPEIGVLDLNRMLGLYAWHSNHHTAHITRLRERNGW
ncbi:MAG TPA: putative metal-dependent hydrolase [Terriglobales bacterium]